MATLYNMPTCTCVKAWLPVLLRLLQFLYGITVRVTQLTGGAVASGGTHTGGGAVDLIVVRRSPRNLRTTKRAYQLIEKLARLAGADASWYRPKSWDNAGGIAHCHITLTRCTHKAQTAKDQLTGKRGVRAGRNGLRNGAPDPGYKPLSGLTWREGLEWMLPQMASTTQPEPEPAPEAEPIGKWQLMNVGAATVALKRSGAWAKWLLRRKRVVIMVRDKDPDVLGILEGGGGSAWSYLKKKVTKFHQRLVVTAGGRSLWRNSKTTGASIDRGVFKPKAFGGDVKEMLWYVGPVNAAMMLTGLAHLDPHASAAFNVKVVDEILDFLEAKATEHHLGKSQIVLMIDTADKTKAVRHRIFERGYASVFGAADKTVNRELQSATYFEPAVEGFSVDDMVVWEGVLPAGKGPDNPRPVEVASKTKPAKPADLDHLVLAAVINRQA